MFDAEKELSDAELERVCGGKEAWQVIGPIVKPILYPVGFRSRGAAGVSGASAQASGSCANGVCR